jgi:hypothetical protein
MSEIKDLIEDIEVLRDNLYKLVAEKQNLLDPEVLAASEILNAAIVKYNELLKKKLHT